MQKKIRKLVWSGAHNPDGLLVWYHAPPRISLYYGNEKEEKAAS